MSHDRGCFKCHEDPSEYANCKLAECPKRDRFAVEPGGDKSDAPPRPLTEQERAQFPREAVLEADLAIARDELARRARPLTLDERAALGMPHTGPFVGDPGYRSGGDASAKRHDADMARVKGVVEVGGELREHDGRSLGRRVERVTRIITVTEPGYDVALFMNEDGGAEAVITRPGLQPTGVNIAPPAPGRRIVIERTGQRFEVVYKDVPR